MKYDRPVWQIMHACADAMPSVFRYEHVREWYNFHYPDVNEATIRAHLIGLTEGGRTKHVQFAQRSPVFRRVARGEYEAIPVDERGEHPGTVYASAARLKMGFMKAGGEAIGSGDPGIIALGPQGPVPGGSDSALADEGAAHRPVRGVGPALNPDDITAPDVILLGSVGERVDVPAPAKEVFREMSFQLARLDAEQTRTEWFILSAEHGLVAPDEWMSPDSRTLADMDPEFRVMWAGWVVARLRSLVGPIKNLHIRVDAPDAFARPLFDQLNNICALVTIHDVGVQMAAVPAPKPDSGHEPDSTSDLSADQVHVEDVPQERMTPAAEAEVTGPRESAPLEAVFSRRGAPLFLTASRAHEPQVLPVHAGNVTTRAAQHLCDPANHRSLHDLQALPDTSGLYGWFVDEEGARELNGCLRLPVCAGLIFVGQVGGSSWQMLADPALNLRDHIGRIQLHGSARASTFRMTLATVLRGHLQMSSLDDPSLTTWMMDHLRVAVWASDNASALRELERIVVGELDPPLNVDHLPAGEYRARLNQMRRALA